MRRAIQLAGALAFVASILLLTQRSLNLRLASSAVASPKVTSYVRWNPKKKLANRMFQFAAAFGIARDRGAVLCGPPILNYRAHRPCPQNTTFTRVDEHGRFAVHTPVPPPVYSGANLSILRYRQSWKYFAKYRSELRDWFTPDVRDRRDRWWKRRVQRRRWAAKRLTTVAVHLRRGDAITRPDRYLRFPPTAYFRQAMRYFRDKYGPAVVFVVSSDDPRWAASRKWLSGRSSVVVVEGGHAAELDMAILARCDHAIVSVGTFGWWIAWLTGGEVVYFADEFIMEHPFVQGNVRKEDYYPPEWRPMTGKKPRRGSKVG